MNRGQSMSAVMSAGVLALGLAGCISGDAFFDRSVRHADDVSLDGTWRFRLDGGAWRDVTVPHDWSIEAAPDGKRVTGKEWGYYPGGVGEYVRTFTLTDEDLEGSLRLVFDGVLRDARVSINGGDAIKGSRYGYTGFSIDLAGLVHSGENSLSVIVDNSNLPGSRWYMGSGINRSVWLVKRGGPFLVPGSLDVRTLSADEKLARVEFSGLRQSGGKIEAVKEVKEIANPVLWTPETPHLYETEFCGERVRYGVRTLAWSAEKGFLLNGKSIEFHGACVHHDHGPLGAASTPEAEYRKALQLKRAGFNAVRTSHNPVAESFLDACDELGILVVDDMFDGRQKGKTKGDYCEVFDQDWRKDVEWIVRRDRVHPSVMMWSVGNEIFEATEPRAAATTKAMREFIAKLDGTRPVTQAIHFWDGDWHASDPLVAELDIAGYNYLEGFTESDHERLPNRIIVYTETYPKDLAMTWRRSVEHSYVLGEFVWTGIDYLGETGIGRNFYADKEQWGEHWFDVPQFPWHGAYCGDIDLAGTRKSVSHYRETLWNADAKTYLAVREPSGWKGEIKTTKWSVWPTHDHWTFAGWEGKNVTAEVYSRRPRVRLTLNGEVVGEKGNSAANAWKVEFELAYRPGELVAEGLDASGAVVERSVLRTAGAPDRVRYLKEKFGRYTYVTAEVVDKDGVVCPYADWEITFEGDVVATCSGDLADNVPAPSKTRKAWLGRALAILSD